MYIHYIVKRGRQRPLPSIICSSTRRVLLERREGV